MTVKKFNAALSLLTIFFLLLHSFYECYLFLVFAFNPFFSKLSGMALGGLILLHAALSCFAVFARHDSKSILYKKLNARTAAQRASAVLMLLFLAPHIFSYNLIKAAESPAAFVLAEAAQILFLAAVYLHVALSFSSALVSLGLLQDAEKKRRIDTAAQSLCMALFSAQSVIIVFTQLKLRAL